MLLKGKTEVIELARDEEVLANDRAAVFCLRNVEVIAKCFGCDVDALKVSRCENNFWVRLFLSLVTSRAGGSGVVVPFIAAVFVLLLGSIEPG